MAPRARDRRRDQARDADGYLPIEHHGIIGDLHTVALVGGEGTIDWFCPERFDAPIDKLSVVLVAIFGVIFLGERLSAPNWLGIALIAVGAVLAVWGDQDHWAKRLKELPRSTKH